MFSNQFACVRSLLVKQRRAAGVTMGRFCLAWGDRTNQALGEGLEVRAAICTVPRIQQQRSDGIPCHVEAS